MSDTAPAEVQGFHELEVLVRHLADELANFRRRALTAEARLKEVEAHEGGAVTLDLANRCSQLEQENERMRIKMDAAMARAKKMLERVKFLRQQAQAGTGVSDR